MKNNLRSQLKKSVGGAILFQVLLGIGLMVLMSPIILNQIQKYNENINREEVISEMSSLQKAVTSFVTFEKDIDAAIPDGLTYWGSDSMIDALSEYLGGSNISRVNKFGQEYSFITYRDGDKVEAVVMASGGGVDDLTLNSIGQYLFDKGAVVGSDKVLLSDFSLSTELKGKIDEYVSPTLGGALVMFVSDAFFSSDFLHTSKMPGNEERGILFNTMLENLNMNSFDVENVNELFAVSLFVTEKSSIDTISSTNLVFEGEADVDGFFEYRNKNGLNLLINDKVVNDVNLPFLSDGSGDSSMLLVDLYLSGNATFKKIEMSDAELAVPRIKLHENINVLGDVELKSDWNDFNFESLEANIIDSEYGIFSDNIDNIIMDDTSVSDSYMYVGEIVSGRYDDIDNIVFNFSGVSEVEDICDTTIVDVNVSDDEIDSQRKSCLSDNLVTSYKNLLLALQTYFDARGGDGETDDTTTPP